jgi:RNA polymerase sigma-70 factor (ECF subfamily)
MNEPETPDALRNEMRTAWYRYVDVIAPLRPALHGYCRRLTRNLWDAEDLVQDTLLRAFGHLGLINHPIRNPRAYLLRTATNVWIDELRRRERDVRVPPTETEDVAAPGWSSRRTARCVPRARACCSGSHRRNAPQSS